MSNAYIQKSQTDDWCTPQSLFVELDEEFHFRCDVAATKDNTKCDAFITKEEDALSDIGWMNINWCNPPYSKTKEFVVKATEEMEKGRLTVMLIPARTDTRVFHEYIYMKKGIEIRFIKGRIKFIHPTGGLLRGTKMNGSNNAAPFPSMIVIFRPDKQKEKK